MVDCTKETSLCSSQDVTGYPTLKFFKDGPENGVKHRGQRDQKSLEKFINEQMGRAPTEEEEIALEPEEAVAEKGLFTLTEKSFKSTESRDTQPLPTSGRERKLRRTVVGGP